MNINIDKVNLELARKVAEKARAYLDVKPSAERIHVESIALRKIKDKALKEVRKGLSSEVKKSVSIDVAYIKSDSRMVPLVAFDSE